MRALLLYNPNATTTTPAVTDVIARALSAELKLDVEATKRRDHASYLAAGAAHEGYEVVVALGGDGTVNEVMQGLVGTDVRLAVIPGGSTNVWARTLGLPNDAVEATDAVLHLLRLRQDRTLNLGSANGRYFAFNCGFGFDAEVVRYVERRYRLKRAVRQASFIYNGFLAYYGGADGQRPWRKVDITVDVDGAEPLTGVNSVVCCNSNPYTYLGPWPAQLCPDADLERGLDLMALRNMRMPRLLRLLRHAISSGGVSRLKFAETRHDVTKIRLTSDLPLALQVDGDFVGEVDSVELCSLPRALTVVA